MDRKAEDGVYPTRAPIGYANEKARGPDGQIRDRGGSIVLQPWGHALLHRMRELRIVDDFSFAAIADRVLEEGLVPPRHQRSFRGGPGAGRAEAILKNPFYVGRFVWRGVEYIGKHERVFTQEEWDELQATFGIGPASGRIVRREATFAGFLKCAECGCQISYDPKTKGERVYHYYRCANGKLRHPKLVYVREEAILDGFKSAVDCIEIDDVLAQQVAAILNETHDAVRATRKREAAQFAARLKELEGREDELYEHLRTRVLDEEGYKRQLGRVREERADLTARLAKANEGLDTAYLKTAQTTLELAKQAKKLWRAQSPAERRRLLETLVSNPRLDGGSVRFDLKKPFQILSEMRENPEWRPNPDTSANFSGRFHVEARRRSKPRPVPTEPPLIVKLLAKAEAWRADLDAGRVKNRVALAIRERTSTVRVTQILRLLDLDPSIKAWIRSLPPGTPARYVAERQLREIATIPVCAQMAAVKSRWGVVTVETGR
jgi:hypothetical protein